MKKAKAEEVTGADDRFTGLKPSELNDQEKRSIVTLATKVLAFRFRAGRALSSPDETRTYQLKNRLRVQYEDNIYETEDDTESSWKIIEELELLVNFHLDQTFVGFRYRPSYVWWDNREPDDSDFHHDFDFVFAHNFTPRLTINLKDTLRVTEQPEEIDRGTRVPVGERLQHELAHGLCVG